MSTLTEAADFVRNAEKTAKERPILFKGEMVRAILSGQKTQTRRVVKLYPADTVASVPCPYGKPGDRLWVREAFAPVPMAWIEDGIEHRCQFAYRASGDSIGCHKWRPSIHMPRMASRILLEIVSVRVERLNDISEADAEAEGIQCENRIIEARYEAGQHIEVTADMYHVDGKRSDAHYSAGECFQSLWESINGPESWQANPWVWVVEFKKVAS